MFLIFCNIDNTGSNTIALTHYCVCPKSEHEFSSAYVLVFFLFNELRLEVIICFVDIG